MLRHEVAVRLPKASSAQAEAAAGFGGSQINWLLSDGLAAAHFRRDAGALDGYRRRALRRAWKAHASGTAG